MRSFGIGGDYLLFYDYDLSIFLKNMQVNVNKFVDDIPKEQFVSNTTEDIIKFITLKLTPIPLKIYLDSITRDDPIEISLDVSDNPNRNPLGKQGPLWVPGIRVVVHISFSGPEDSWNVKPSITQNIFPHGIVFPVDASGFGHLDITLEKPNDESNNIKEELDKILESIKFYIEQQEKQIAEHNALIGSIVQKHVDERKKRLEQHEMAVKLLEIPLKQNENSPPLKPIDISEAVKPLSPAPKTKFKQEYGITEEIYNAILLSLRHVCRTFEDTPKTFSVHDEEELRDILLANLNGYFKSGVASGETFRKKGKADITIEAENRAAFISECKIWYGSKELLEAVDQLLGYLIWRDCKAALIIFNKHNKGFTEIREAIPETLKTHPKFKKLIKEDTEEGEWDFIFASGEDDARLVQVRVFVFNIFFERK